MTTQEKKELLQDFLDKIWYRDIYLMKKDQFGDGDGKVIFYYQEDEDIINWYLRS